MCPLGAELVHIWNRCHACGAAPIVGLRFTCQTCPSGPENDLCEPCFRLFEKGRLEHPLLEARDAPPGRHIFRSFEGTARKESLPWLAVPWPSASAPTVPDRAVVRPEFRSGPESFFGSYGFVVFAEDGTPPLVLTALHVLDELAKFRGINCSVENTAYTGRELPSELKHVQLYDPFAQNWVLAELGTATGMLKLPYARINTVEPYSQQDIAAFHATASSAFQPFRLAAEPPIVGDPIWLAVNPGGRRRERTIAAVLVEIAKDIFVFRFFSRSTMPAYTSGAPLLNGKGEVVGINVGGGSLDEQALGHGVHVVNIRLHLGW